MSIAHTIGQPIIPVIIDSDGGRIDCLRSMVTMIENSKIPIATIVEGRAYSCGSVLFSCGAQDHRYISPHAKLLIHQASAGTFGKVEEMKNDTEEFLRTNDWTNEILAKNCGKDPDYFKRMQKKHRNIDWWISPKEAMKHNLANHIGIPEMVVKVRVFFEFGMTEKSKKKHKKKK